jgi:CRISPR-associated endonuclease Cas2
MPHLFCYDISADGPRLKVANKLLEFGCIRLQYSVFAGDLRETHLKELLAWLKTFHTNALQPTDSILILTLTLNQLKSTDTFGPAPPDWDMLTQPPNTLII